MKNEMDRGTPLFIACLFLSAISFAASTVQSESAYHHYLRALLHESQGNYLPAQEEVEKAIALAPGNAYLYRTAAELSLRLGQINKASEEIEKATELGPDDPKNLILAGQIAWALGDSAKAEKYLRKALEINPDQPEAVVSLAGALAPSDPKESIRLYKDYLNRHPGEVGIQERVAQIYQGVGDLENAKESWEKTLEWAPSSLKAHLALAQIAEVNFDTATAVAHYEAVLAQDPANLPLLLRVGELRYRNNEMAKAYEAFSKAQSLAPESTSANFWLALLSEHRGDWKEAIRLLEQVSGNTKDPGLLLRLSYYYSQAGRHRDAIRVLKKLSDLDPGNIDFLTYLAVAYEQDKQYANAEKTLQKIVALDPKNPEYRFQLAALLDRVGKFSRAEEELKQVIALKPDYHIALNYLGYSYADRNKNLIEAEKLINDAVALDPGNPAYLDSMGWVYYRLGKLGKAEDFLREATRRVRDPVIWDHLGDVLIAKGETSEAVLAWNESLRAEPSQKKVNAKMNAALGKLSVKERFQVFMKRAVAQFGSLQSVRGVVDIKVCESKPCFESKAQFDYTKAKELRVEVPGPLAAPLMLLSKLPDEPAVYGAIHPLFQTVEYHITRAFERVESLLSASVLIPPAGSFREVKKEGGMLVGEYPFSRILFDSKSGILKEISWTQGTESDRLTITPYASDRAKAIPQSWMWRDQRTGFEIRLLFHNPAVVFTDEAKTPD